uniref:Putative secreted protein n=1 Tax=Anopheles darlingi TaxID=43151 RepID=A0A2M4DH69_ANODA
MISIPMEMAHWLWLGFTMIDDLQLVLLFGLEVCRGANKIIETLVFLPPVLSPKQLPSCTVCCHFPTLVIPSQLPVLLPSLDTNFVLTFTSTAH